MQKNYDTRSVWDPCSKPEYDRCTKDQTKQGNFIRTQNMAMHKAAELLLQLRDKPTSLDTPLKERNIFKVLNLIAAATRPAHLPENEKQLSESDRLSDAAQTGVWRETQSLTVVGKRGRYSEYYSTLIDRLSKRKADKYWVRIKKEYDPTTGYSTYYSESIAKTTEAAVASAAQNKSQTKTNQFLQIRSHATLVGEISLITQCFDPRFIHLPDDHDYKLFSPHIITFIHLPARPVMLKYIYSDLEEKLMKSISKPTSLRDAQDSFKASAQLAYDMIIWMPFINGTRRITEVLLRAIWHVMGFQVDRFKSNPLSWDFHALICPDILEFESSFKFFFESKPGVIRSKRTRQSARESVFCTAEDLLAWRTTCKKKKESTDSCFEMTVF